MAYYSLNIKCREQGKILKAAKEKQVTYKSKHKRITADFITEILKTRRTWN
jgi:hypothetical protein